MKRRQCLTIYESINSKTSKRFKVFVGTNVLYLEIAKSPRFRKRNCFINNRNLFIYVRKINFSNITEKFDKLLTKNSLHQRNDSDSNDIVYTLMKLTKTFFTMKQLLHINLSSIKVEFIE